MNLLRRIEAWSATEWLSPAPRGLTIARADSGNIHLGNMLIMILQVLVL